MPLNTCNVKCTINDDTGAPVKDARITARLDRFEVFAGYVVPQEVIGITDENGITYLELWPNQLGSTESMYVIRVVTPNGKSLTTKAVVPNLASIDLHVIAELPAYDGKSDADAAMTLAVTAASEARASADSVFSSLTEVSNQATSATNSATIATAKAAFANDKAAAAAVSAESSSNFADASAASAAIYTDFQAAFASQATSLIQTQTIVVQHHAFA